MRTEIAGSAQTFGEIVYPPGSGFGPRRQPSVELVAVFSGSMTVWVDGTPRVAPAATACVLLPGREERFAFAAHEPTHHAWVHFWDDGFADAALLARLAPLRAAIPLSRGLAADLRELLAFRAWEGSTRAELETLTARRALLRFVGEAEHGVGDGPSDPVQRALAAIDDGLHTRLDVPALARAAAVSRAHLIRLFHAELGTTPAAYLWERRVDRGLQLLQETGLPVAEVARLCGFTSPEHFSRRVTRRTGLGPAAYRARRWEGGA